MHSADSAPLLSLVNLFEMEEAARLVIDPSHFGYYAAGANDEMTLADNIDAYRRTTLRPRVMVDVSQRDTTTTLLGRDLSMPLLVAPMAFQCLANAEGEVATARAADAMGCGMILSTFSTSPVPDVRSATADPLWFQLYVYKDRAATEELVDRAERAGCEALVFTVDAPVIGRRERDVRSRVQLPAGVRVANALPGSMTSFTSEMSDSGLAQYVMQMIDPALSWRDIEWLRSITTLPIILKGVQRADDAATAVKCGVDGIVVSNHGGRQLDTARASFDVLPEVVAAVEGRAVVLVDGGIRRGTDIIKAIATGADAVLLGRPILWGLAVAGETGVRHVLELLRNEFDLAMALCGCTNVAEITSDLLSGRNAL